MKWLIEIARFQIAIVSLGDPGLPWFPNFGVLAFGWFPNFGVPGLPRVPNFDVPVLPWFPSLPKRIRLLFPRPGLRNVFWPSN